VKPFRNSRRPLLSSSVAMPSPLFQFFEMVAEELTLEQSRVLTSADFDPAGNDSSVLDELRDELRVLTNDQAIREAVQRLTDHFEARGSRLPFSFDAATSRFQATDLEYLKLTAQMREIRGEGKNAKEFELTVMQRIKLRITGSLHRVGHPRDVHKKREEFNKYLSNLGFNGHVLLDKEKDGGFDILWELPIGAKPHRPFISLQCKNSSYSLTDGDASCGPAKRSLNQHKGLMSEVHVLCVFFNDYITHDILPKKAMHWVALGLSDLGIPRSPEPSVTAI
jgi:hypothetical protein